MLRATTNVLARLNVSEAKCGQSAFALEFVRWRRKPRWLPVAKSKLFRVPERKVQDPDEKAELQRLNNNYKTQMRSVRQYLREEALRIKATTTADHIVLTPEQEEIQYQHCLAENEKWNQEIAAIRNERLEKERQERAAYIRERLELAELRNEERLQKIEEKVRYEKEASKTFITPANIDAAIEQALANPVDYNFSIDLQGNLYHGRTSTPGNSGGGASTAIGSGTDEGEQAKLKATN